MNHERAQILLVEDSVQDAEMTMRTLARRGIADCIDWVRDGCEALEYLRHEGRYAHERHGLPQLILLDLKMPRMDGLQLLARLKSDPDLRVLPVVMMTSSREESDLVASYELGVNSFVVKPVEFDDFAEKVSQVGMYWMLANESPVTAT